MTCDAFDTTGIFDADLSQDRIGSPDDVGIHVTGIAHILNEFKAASDFLDTFDTRLAISLCSMMVRTFQSLVGVLSCI